MFIANFPVTAFVAYVTTSFVNKDDYITYITLTLQYKVSSSTYDRLGNCFHFVHNLFIFMLVLLRFRVATVNLGK